METKRIEVDLTFLVEVLKTQEKLDTRIAKEKGLDISSDEYFINRLTALTGELYETLAVVEPFKDWKDNKGKIDYKRFVYSINLRETDVRATGKIRANEGYLIDKSNGVVYTLEECLHRTLVEECSDVLHFIASLLNYAGVKVSSLTVDGKASFTYDTDININFIKCIVEIANIYEDSELCSDDYAGDLFFAIIHYFLSLGVTMEELKNAYFYKNKINHQRVEDGY